MRGITVRFPGVVANEGVDLTVERGEVHALLGENGAGKSTLMGVLDGLVAPVAGEVHVFGERLALGSPRASLAAGVGMVFQHFMLVPTLTVAENVLLAQDEPRWLVHPKAARARVAALAEEHRLPVDPGALVADLSVAEQQRVEILKVLARGARVLVLDEPTAVLSPGEARELCRALADLARSGKAVILIGHKLREILSVADRCTVLRRGRVVASGLAATGLDEDELGKLMVGKPIAAPEVRTEKEPGEAVLELHSVSALSDRGTPALRDVSLTVRAGEIVGIAAVAGNGQRELAEIAAGQRAVTAGQVLIAGRDLGPASPRAFLEAGVAHVPEDRAAEGSAGALDLADNLILKTHRRAPFRRGLWLDRKAALRHAEEILAAHEIAAASPAAAASTLSGGNLQRLILARELGLSPRLLVAAQPTRGLDVAATARIHERLVEARDAGAGILLVSEDLEEILALSDRVLVMCGGRVVGERPRGADPEVLGPMMIGRPSGDGT